MSINDEILKQILAGVNDSKDALGALDRKLELHIQSTAYELREIRALDETQNAILDEHHKRSDRLAEDNKLREEKLRLEINESLKRIEKLETPYKIATWIKTTVLWIAGLAGALVGLHEFVDKVLK